MTEPDYEKLADEAEKGYDVSSLVDKPMRRTRSIEQEQIAHLTKINKRLEMKIENLEKYQGWLQGKWEESEMLKDAWKERCKKAERERNGFAARLDELKDTLEQE